MCSYAMSYTDHIVHIRNITYCQYDMKTCKTMATYYYQFTILRHDSICIYIIYNTLTAYKFIQHMSISAEY